MRRSRTPWLLLTPLLLGACVRAGAPRPERVSCPALDAGGDALGDAAASGCGPLTALRCEADDPGCEEVLRCASIDLDFTRASLPEGVSLSRGSPAYHVNAAGALVLAPADTPRLDYSPSTGELRGLLVEGEARNLVPWSSALDRWTPEKATVKDTGIVGPSGDRALVLEATGGAVPHRLRAPEVPSFSYAHLTLSLFVRPLRSDHAIEIVLDALNQTITAAYDLDTGANATSSSAGSLSRYLRIESSYPGGWQRIALSVSLTGGQVVTSPVRLWIGVVAGGSFDPVAGDGKESFAVWGVQLEQGATATSPIPTSGSPAVRQADRVRYPAGQAVRLTKGTLLLEAVFPYHRHDGRTPTALAATGASGSLSLLASSHLEVSATGPQGSVKLTANQYRLHKRRPHRAAVRCDGARWDLYEDAGQVAGAVQDIGAVDVTSFTFGSGGALDPFFGHLRRFAYWPAPLAKATMEVLAR